MAITLGLTENEGLVLFEFLSRFREEEDLRIDDQAEERVLWNMCCLLEKQLAQPYDSKYLALLENTRNEVRDDDTEGAG